MTENDLVVRRVNEAELDETAALLRAVFGATLDGRHPAYLEELVDLRARSRHAELFVAVSEGRIVGTGSLYPPGDAERVYPTELPRRPWPSTWALLRALAVDPAHRGRGVGRRLIEERVERARALGASAVALHCGSKREDVARLFTQRGFARASRYDFFPLPDVRAEAYVLSLR